MASKAVAVKVDWSKLATKVNVKPQKFNKFKSRIDSTSVKLNTLPERLPEIDWSFYRANAADPKIVEELQRSYTSVRLERPKPTSGRLEELEKAKKQDLARFERYAAYAKSCVESAEVVKKKFENMIPCKDMTCEDWSLTFPYWSTSVENPSIGPHWNRTPGLTKEEMIAFEQPDPVPFATPTAWKDWEERKKKFYS